MKKKILSVLALVLLCALSGTAYGAGIESNILDENSILITGNDLSDVLSRIYMAHSSDILANVELNITADITQSGTRPVTMSDYPNITGLTINGGNHTITPSPMARSFVLDSTPLISFVLSSVTLGGFSNASTSGGGVEISAGSGIMFSGVTFSRIMSDTDGGAVSIQGGSNITLSGCTFTDCYAPNGGAVHVSGGTNIILSGTNKFSGNTATDSGGAIYTGTALNFSGLPEFSGNTADTGGAVYSSAALTFSAGATFSGNTASADGGAAYATGTLAFLAGGTFTRNTAAANGGAICTTSGLSFTSTSAVPSFSGNKADMGGAIYSTGSPATFTAGATFTGNNAGTNGGAIHYATGTLTFTTGGTFTDNTAGTDGGAIYSSGNMIFTAGGTFTGNTAGSNGGAVSITGLKGTFTDTVFGDEVYTANSAPNGGAVYISSGSSGEFKGAKFTNNSADNGGAIYTAGALTLDSDTNNIATEFAGTTLVNRALYGGALYISGTGSTEMKGTGTITYSRNTASKAGGAIYSSGQITGTAPVAFTSNRAGVYTDSTNESYGGAVYIYSGETSSGNATFTGNTASYGGALYVYGGQVTFTGTADFGGENTANQAVSGGAVFITGGTTTFTGKATFSYNTASMHGGALLTSGDTATVKFDPEPPSFNRNTAQSGNGGAVYWGASSSPFPEVFTRGTEFTNNRAVNGGAVYVSGTASITLKDEYSYTFSGNTAGSNGGAVCAEHAAVTLEDFTLESGNSATDCGGFAYSGGALTVNSCDISGQSAKSGGALYGNSTVNITDARFHGNTAENGVTNDTDGSGGGAVFGVGNITVSSSNFYGNKSKAQNITIQNNGGGAIYAAADITITGTSFDSNAHEHASAVDSSSGGGAVHARGNVTITGSVFTDNTTTNRGGAVYSDKAGTFSVSDTIYSGNISGHHGGAVYAADADLLSIGTTTFSSNQANNDHGGAMYVLSVTARIANSYFKDNKTISGNGGSICFDQSGGVNGSAVNPASNFSLTECVLTGNMSTIGHGGAAYIHTDNATIKRCTFSDNEAFYFGNTTNGGALFLWAELSSTISDSTFVKNTASGSPAHGGALYTQGTVAVTSSTFTLGNTADGNSSKGGAIYASSGQLTLTATIAVGNTASVGSDIHAEAPVQSGEYNRIGIFGHGERIVQWDNYVTNDHDCDNMEMSDYESRKWTTATFFGDDAALADNETTFPAVGASPVTSLIQTVALVENNNLPLKAQAIDVIPRRYVPSMIDAVDQRGMKRPMPDNDDAEVDVGAFELVQGGRANSDDNKPAVLSVVISGIPGTLKNPGQTLTLIAVVRYSGNKMAYGGNGSGQEPVEGSSSNTNILSVDQSGNVVAGYNQSGLATITVKVIRAMADGSYATASLPIYVNTNASTSMNMDETFYSYYHQYIEDLFEYDMALYFGETSSSAVNSSVFQSSFKRIWSGVTASQVSGVNTSSLKFSSETNHASSDGSIIQKPGVHIDFKGASVGDMLPMTYSWTLTGDEVKSLVGEELLASSGFYNVSQNLGVPYSVAEALFSAVNIKFQSSGVTRPVIGGDGADLNQAIAGKSLVLTKADGGSGIRMDMTAYLANVAAETEEQGPQIVRYSGADSILVVPDGTADDSITGTMWLLSSSATDPESGTDEPTGQDTPSSSGDGGSGGGGCNALSIGLLEAVFIFALKKR